MHLNQKNPLLARDDVGRAKPPTYDLPPEGYQYGLKNKPRVEGANEVIHKPVAEQQKALPLTEKNYAKINVEAQGKRFAKRGEYLEFTKNKEIRVKRKLGCTEIENQLPAEDFTYGVANRPSTPVSDVMSELRRKLLRQRRGEAAVRQVHGDPGAKEHGKEAQGQGHPGQ